MEMSGNDGMVSKLGGRKFLLALIAIGVGTAIELTTDRGVSASFAALLAGIVAAFGAANAVITSRAMATSSDGGNVAEISEQASVDLTPVTEKLAELDAAQIKLSEAVSQVGLVASNTNKLLAAALAVQKPK